PQPTIPTSVTTNQINRPQGYHIPTSLLSSQLDNFMVHALLFWIFFCSGYHRLLYLIGPDDPSLLAHEADLCVVAIFFHMQTL
ncbi:MAG TPA: hypothetical protein PLK98_00795, partial [Methanothrix sp.]|nr:hypothetical protein [Methanothrix sp.]